MTNSSITFKNINISYDKSSMILEDVNFSIPENSYCAIIGENGAGKSTLIKLVAGLIKQSKGQVEHSFRRIAYLPQNGNFNRNFPIAIEDILKMGKYVYPDNDYSQKAQEKALAEVKLNISSNRPISNLSGGQFQRVLFARILLQNPDLLLLDEPFNGIDEETVQDLANILTYLHSQGKTILIAIHDWNFVNNFVPLIIDVKNSKAIMRYNQNLKGI